MCILHAREFEVLFPVGPLLQKGRRAVADFHPSRSLIWEELSILHIAQILALGDGALTESFLFDCFQEVGLPTCLHASSDQITHRNPKCETQ